MHKTSALLKVGIIGYGKIGRIRQECVRRNPALTLMGVCDLAGMLSQPGLNVYSDYRALLDDKPDLVFVCTFNRCIPEIAIEAISRGVHVFSEKPPGRTLADVLAIQDAAVGAPGVKVKFGFNHRYHEAVAEAKAIVHSGRLGEVMWMRGVYGKAGGAQYDKNWRNNRELSGGGILIDQGIHMLDLFRYFSGEFDQVKSFTGQTFWKQVDVEDNAFALLRNNAGVMAMLHSSATQWRHKFLLEIYLTRGYMEIDGILSSTRSYGRETLKIARCLREENGYPLPNPQESLHYYDDDRSWFEEVDEFVSCILKDLPVKCGNVDDAVKTMELVARIYADAAGEAKL
ncbi:MAG: Gfo/Idh/MocA family oxidoreductase [Candidatus Omnitrophica bacterium]|nr:Gfo/Idh/MocA family oxidoreductase [Candidatus Omnitrophota bacterium]